MKSNVLKPHPLFILLNDIHIDKQKGELVKDIFNQVIKIAHEYDVNYLMLGGDVFTNRSGQPLDCLSTFQDILDTLSDNNIFTHVIPGNHDKTDPDDYRSYVDIYRGNKNLRIHREGVSMVLGGCCVAMIPYFSEEKWLDEFNRVQGISEAQYIDGDLSKDAFSVLITHMGFDGVRNNDGSEVVSDLKPSLLDFYDKVLVGHYHNASKVGKNVYYTGAAYQNDFGENVVDKGCTIVYTDGTLKFIPLKFPKHIKHVIDVNDSETLRNLLEKYEGEKYDKIRFIFQGKKVDASKVDLSAISALGIQCRFESIEEKEAVDNSVDENALNYNKQSITKDFLKFCSENQIKGAFMKYGLNLIKSI